jgi:hypothetical protein
MYLTLKTLSLFVVSALLASQLDSRQADDAAALRMSHNARTPAAKGTRIRVPPSVLAKVKADRTDCAMDAPNELQRFDSYRIPLNNKGAVGVAVWGRSSCYCGATGNCAFWIFRQSSKSYEPLLKTDMVRDFGFLTSTNNSLRDFVAWSHDSAELSPARLYRFDGTGYREVCGWDEQTKYREGPDGSWIAGKTTIESNGCAEADLRSK